MRLAVIGLGERSMHLLRRLLKLHPQLQIVAVVDPALDQISARLKDLGLASADVRRFESIDGLLSSGIGFDAGMIGTRCSMHTPLAVRFAETGLPLYLEKPIAINWQQFHALKLAYAGREEKVVVSFPLRITPLLQKVMQIVHSGALGTINQVQAVNNVPYGGVYYGQWYRDFNETGGLWLQKATHDFDYINRVIGANPARIAAMGTRRIYGGDMPEDLRCSACSRTAICTESPENSARRGDHGGMGADDHWCPFSSSVRHHDAGSALIQYDNGVHASYSQNFISRRSAAKRGATIVGYEAALEFDWYQDAGRVIYHLDDKVEPFKTPPAEGHGGGDDELLKNFIDVVEGRGKSRSDLRAGLLSVAMCLAAQKSEETSSFQPVEYSLNLTSPGVVVGAEA